jgi:hypothetical protein
MGTHGGQTQGRPGYAPTGAGDENSVLGQKGIVHGRR